MKTCHAYSRELEQAVSGIKASEERRHEYMIMMLKEQEVLEKGRAEGRAEGMDHERIQNLKSLMAVLGVSVERVLELLGVPEGEWEKYASQI